MLVVNIPTKGEKEQVVLSGKSEPWSDKGFLDLVQANPDMRLERSAEGEVIIMAPTGGDSGRRNTKVTSQLDFWTGRHGDGIVFDSSTGFMLPNNAIRSPDTAWVASKRWEKLDAEERAGILPICPDFVVELRSRTDRISVVRAKMREYIENGARLGWLIDPQTKQVEVYKPNAAVKTLKEPASVSGEDVLPGFTLDLAPIWE